MVWDWRVSRAWKILFYWHKLLAPLFYCFHFLFVYFRIVGLRSLTHSVFETLYEFFHANYKSTFLVDFTFCWISLFSFFSQSSKVDYWTRLNKTFWLDCLLLNTAKQDFLTWLFTTEHGYTRLFDLIVYYWTRLNKTFWLDCLLLNTAKQDFLTWLFTT